MRRSFPIFVLFVAAYLTAIGWGWFRQAGTGGELLGHAAKIEAILRLLQSGDFGWFPDYLSGSPSATLLGFALAVPVYGPALLVVANQVVAMKAVALLLLALGGFTAFAFGRRLSGGNGWSGFAVGCAYLLAPQIAIRVGLLEHMTIALAIPLVPLCFLALLRLAERGTPFDGILLAVAWSAAMLAWSKMGATLLIPLAMFAAWLFLARPECRINLLKGAVWAVPGALLLGIVPLLPLLRERSFMAAFEFDPLHSWQAAYSIKTGTAWFDRAGELFASLPIDFQVDHGGYYLGFVGLVAMFWTVFTTWHRPRQPREIALIRLFLLIALAMYWISFGPRNVLMGHFEFLAVAQDFPDLGIPLHWLVLLAQCALIYWCIPSGRWRNPVCALLVAIYLLVPAFSLLEHLPIYGDLRAPDSFWILNGTFAWVVASALAVVFVLGQVSKPALRALLGLIILAGAVFDFSPYFKSFYRGGLAPETFSHFQEISARLRATPGRILPVSGRYFYLDLPHLAGRPLSSEALNHYLMPRDTLRLQAAARLSAADMLSYLNLAGISSILLDRKDSDVQATSAWFRGFLPVEFENEEFSILSNPTALFPGFFATVSAPAPAGFEEYGAAIDHGKTERLSVSSPTGAPIPALPGSGSKFTRLTLSHPRSSGLISFALPGQEGWAVLAESWHPDWTATLDGAPAPVYRAAGALPAVAVQAGNRQVEFRFQPPVWYSVCLLGSLLAWLAALVFLAGARWLPARLRTRKASPAAPGPEIRRDRPPVLRPLALVPTYNEAASIDELLERLLACHSDLHVLVIDDASPDGTSALVRAHAGHGSRIHLLERPAKLGLGPAYRDGFRWAGEHGYDACVEIDADLSHDPADIPRLLAALDDGADAAIGSRYLDGVRVINWPLPRLLLSTGASRYVRRLTGLPLTDATSGFKALRASALAGIDWRHLRADGYGFQVELHWLLWKAGCRLVEIPIVFTERRAGQTKMTTTIAVEAAWRVLQLAVMDSSADRRKS